MTQDAKVVETLTREQIAELRAELLASTTGAEMSIMDLCDMALRAEKAEREAERWNKSYARWVVAFVRAGIPAFDTLDTALERLIAKHADELSEARRKALEEAAKVCEERVRDHRVCQERAGTQLAKNLHLTREMEALRISSAIRAMQEPAQGCSLSPGKLET